MGEKAESRNTLLLTPEAEHVIGVLSRALLKERKDGGREVNRKVALDVGRIIRVPTLPDLIQATLDSYEGDGGDEFFPVP